MPAKYTLHVVLNERLVRYVRDKVVAGHHPTASDVVRDSLRKLMERDDMQKLHADVSRRADADG
ncbi:ribbon-helix-helix domain-containing protein [Lichenifustis flavocetrariae]|uniref:Type II toxin-antitoxin system ParD family antitoxin n=1 Tax=Lichenifustis flavocetrariae TaxID=2949735 RepID=A0AA41YYX7_9HYPH|nr:type II toxin-antitoxin system ParD family antitoxin [Lichenifustis flavocetrariae]MCW6509855.1 type II toxin-antitoxin system ParD family antitoxin [Lichenifustis flavocetrariae]